MKTTYKQHLLAGALVGVLVFTIPSLRAQDQAAASPNAASLDKKDAASDDAAELAKKLNNPIASLISVPLQNNFDFGAGPRGQGFQYKVNIQPVIPIGLSDDWNLITRTILPVVYQEKIYGNSSQSGLSDLTESLFFSPKAFWHGWTWGAGPVLLFPTATDDLLGTEKWGAGPTAVFLKQEHGFTYGTLVNQIWSYAGESDRSTVNSTYLQPFLVYTLKTHTSFALNTESTYDWQHDQWTVPLNLSVKQLLKIGGAPVQFEFGGRYYAEKPTDGPKWGLRFTVTFLFPK